MRGRLPRCRLRTKIVAWSFVPAIIILSLTAVFAYQSYQRVTETQVFERDRELAGLLAQQMAAQLTDFADILDSVASLPEIQSFEPAVQAAALRWSMGRLRVFDAGVLVLDASGKVVAADPRRLEAVGEDWSGRSYVREALRQGGQIVFSDILPEGPEGSDAGQELAVAVALPLRGADGRYRGVISGLFAVRTRYPGELTRSLLKVPVGDNRRLYLVDDGGRAIYHYDARWLGSDLSVHPIVEELVAGQTGARHSYDLAGHAVLASFAPLPGTPWGVVIEEDWSALAATYEGYARQLILLLALALIVPVLVVVFGVRRITRPLAELTHAVEEVAGGRLGQPIRLRSGDELERLADRFNYMSAELAESHAELERRVAARTGELSTLNAIIALIGRSLDLEEILGSALVRTLDALGLQAGVAHRLDEPGGALVLTASYGLDTSSLGAIAHLEAKNGPAASNDGPQVRRLEARPAGDGQYPTWAEAQGWQAVVDVPLTAKGQLLGTMALALPAGRELSGEQMSMLAAIGQQAGVALENARLYRHSQEVAAAAERGRLARELHDSVTQTLFSANLIAGVLPTLWQRSPAMGQRRLVELRTLTQGALAEMRTLLLELRPTALIETPLADLLQQLALAATVRSRVPVRVEVGGQINLPAGVQVTLYRIAQEALSNMTKYARATAALVTLNDDDQTGEVSLGICDDGRGFDPQTVAGNHLGLKIMHERVAAIGARLAVVSRPGCGTQVSVVWKRTNEPLEEELCSRKSQSGS
jgi:nitrate/nitrite-specific signal transduction histidine kinase